MEPMVWVWLGITVALLVFEICTTSLTSIWFAAGSLTAFVLSLFASMGVKMTFSRNHLRKIKRKVCPSR